MDVAQLGSGKPQKEIIAVALMASGMHHFLKQVDMDKIHAAPNKDTMINITDGSAIRLGSINDITSIEEYYRQYPDKAPMAGGAQQPAQRQFSNDRKIAVAQLIEDWTPMCERFKFTDVEKLVLTTWESLEQRKGSFEDYCIKHKALTPDGKVTTGVWTDDKGVQQRSAFAYPFFCAVKQAIDTVQAKEVWEAEHTVDFNNPNSFDKIIDNAPQGGVEAMVRGLDKYLVKNPNNNNAKKLREKMIAKLKTV